MAFTASATNTVLDPGCFCTASVIDRVPEFQDAMRFCWTSSRTVPTSRNRTGAPFLYDTVRFPNSAALFNCPLAETVSARFFPESTPVGRLTFAELMAVATSSMPMPRLASARGSTCTRAAYFIDPNTFTAATPLTCDIRWAITVSAYSSSCDSGIVLDRTIRYKIGWSAGFVFCMDGGIIPGGSTPNVFEIADCTSSAAPSRLRSSVN